MNNEVPRLRDTGIGDGPSVTATCPWCGREATFDRVGVKDLTAEKMWFGQRRCPNNACHGHVFYIKTEDGIVTFPPQRIDFEKQSIPGKVASVLEEAITCHANRCYIATGMMIRRTLEEICQERKAEGKYLKDRIRDLGGRIVLPKELLEGIDELRLLGNDAAHVQSREYNNVGEEEVETGIKLAKEFLRATYQYRDLLDSLRDLKKKP